MTVTPADARLDGKVAVVTGAAQGIGEATALALAAFGADVAVCDRTGPALAETAAAIRQLGRRAHEGVLDVRDEEAAGAWLAQVGEEFGKVDILVNNAGGGFHAWFLDVTAKGQTALVNENFTSVTTFIRGCVPLMPDGGSIINVTSIEAHRAAPGFAVYAAMKAGVEELTRTLSLELSDRRIRVNTIAPDAIPTPGDDGLAQAVGITDDEGDFGWKIPLGLGTPDDCAGRGGVAGRRPVPLRQRQHRPCRRRQPGRRRLAAEAGGGLGAVDRTGSVEKPHGHGRFLALDVRIQHTSAGKDVKTDPRGRSDRWPEEPLRDPAAVPGRVAPGRRQRPALLHPQVEVVLPGVPDRAVDL